MNDTFNSSVPASPTDFYSDMLYQSYFNTNNNYIQCNEEDEEEDTMMPVPQHLDLEQINYEFPPKSELKRLAYLDQLEEQYSFFDETSFTTTISSNESLSSSILSGYFDNNTTLTSLLIDDVEDQEKDMDNTRIYNHLLNTSIPSSTHHELLVDDNHLSPLQLPAQAHQRIQSSDSILTIKHQPIVAPESFLSMPSFYKSNNHQHNEDHPSTTLYVTQNDNGMLSPPTLSRLNSLESLNLPIYITETEPILEDDQHDDSSMSSDCLNQHFLPTTTTQQVVLIKINKHGNKKPISSRCPTTLTFMGSDEGYEDEDEDRKQEEIESASIFLPMLDEDHPSHPFHSVEEQVERNMIASTCQYYEQQQEHLLNRIEHLERQLNEEKGMRQAFEKVMEKVAMAVDHQQTLLSDRLEQEINMRQTYEKKMMQALSQLKPLEDQLKKETDARHQLEETMIHCLDQIHSLQQQQQKISEQDEQKRKKMQQKLDQAILDIDHLSNKSSSTLTTLAGTTVVSSSTSTSSLSSSLSSSTITKVNSNSNINPHTTNTINTTTTSNNTIKPIMKQKQTKTPSRPSTTPSSFSSSINKPNTKKNTMNNVRSNAITNVTSTTNKTVLKTNNRALTVRPSKVTTTRSKDSNKQSNVATSKRIILHQ
ncbi:unnamed protein product [Cunninghamella blakesleeana]